MPKATPRESDTILVPTDFSEGAAVGLRWAIELARDGRRRLHLVHALTTAAWPLEYSPSVPDLLQDVESSSRRRLESLAAEVSGQGLETTVEVRTGRPSDVVLEAAKARRASLIVIATRGLSGLDHALLGSTAERIVRCAPCPVMTVKADADHPPGSLQRLLVATDLSKESRAGADAVAECLAGARKILLVHAYEVHYDLGAEGAVTSAAVAHDLCETTRHHALRKLEETAEHLRGRGLLVETVAAEGRAPDIILEIARARKIDAITMGTHGRTGLRHALLGSVAERVVRLARCPVLTIHRDIAVANAMPLEPV